jgi:hypothetical protein
MRKLLLTVALVVGISGISAGAPKIEVPETNWDFGHVPQNSTLTHDYWIRNVGTDSLKIIKVKPG